MSPRTRRGARAPATGRSWPGPSPWSNPTGPTTATRRSELLVELLPHAGGAHRVGITGVPGVGKSTFIDALGTKLTGAGHRVAVLAVDPSSTRTGGSILGDKTRMNRLATDAAAFVRPSPTSGTLGGVARATRETIVLMEAAGYDTVLVETVGVGQSEVAVANMVDTFLFLALARTGDSLQGIKKGILELADVIAVNKADGDHEREAAKAARELSGALRLLPAADPSAWRTPVLTCSGLTGTGLDDVWTKIQAHRTALARSRRIRREARPSAGRLDLVDGPRHPAGRPARLPSGPRDRARNRSPTPRRRADRDPGRHPNPRRLRAAQLTPAPRQPRHRPRTSPRHGYPGDPHTITHHLILPPGNSPRDPIVSAIVRDSWHSAGLARAAS